jgi:Na+/melibiose symporter-like transporter
MFTADFVEYGQFKRGKRVQGSVYSVQTFTCKLFTAAFGALAMFIMGEFGFAEGAGAVQPQSALDAIYFLTTLFPAVGCAIAVPFLFLARIKDKDVQTMARINSGEIPRADGEKLLSAKLLK